MLKKVYAFYLLKSRKLCTEVYISHETLRRYRLQQTLQTFVKTRELASERPPACMQIIPFHCVAWSTDKGLKVCRKLWFHSLKNKKKKKHTSSFCPVVKVLKIIWKVKLNTEMYTEFIVYTAYMWKYLCELMWPVFDLSLVTYLWEYTHTQARVHTHTHTCTEQTVIRFMNAHKFINISRS